MVSVNKESGEHSFGLKCRSINNPIAAAGFPPVFSPPNCNPGSSNKVALLLTYEPIHKSWKDDRTAVSLLPTATTERQ